MPVFYFPELQGCDEIIYEKTLQKTVQIYEVSVSCS